MATKAKPENTKASPMTYEVRRPPTLAEHQKAEEKDRDPEPQVIVTTTEEA